MHVNVICVCINVLLSGSGRWVEGRARGIKAVDCKQGTWEDGIGDRLSKSGNFLLSFFKQYSLAPIFVLYMHNKKYLSVQVKNKPHIRIRIMHSFLVYMVTNNKDDSLSLLWWIPILTGGTLSWQEWIHIFTVTNPYLGICESLSFLLWIPIRTKKWISVLTMVIPYLDLTLIITSVTIYGSHYFMGLNWSKSHKAI
jgi:hypothetical protein